MTLKIEAIPAFDDNYIWLITQSGTQNCIVVDPGDEEPVLQRLKQSSLNLSAILITHKHYDHTGGVAALKHAFPAAQVYGPGNEAIAVIEKVMTEGDEFVPNGLSQSFKVHSVPGHTEGHLAYQAGNNVFCGDTLFAGGCGRVFSGTFEQMTFSLMKIAAMDPETRLYCAHEYTQANLGFGLWVEPDNLALKARSQQTDSLRQKNQPTVPSLLKEELQTNPFLRIREATVKAAASRWAEKELINDVEVFTALRQWKDREYD